MSDVVKYGKVLNLANELLGQYRIYRKQLADYEEGMTFGKWVMEKHYPSIDYRSNASLSDMVTAVRTSDAKTRLVTNLRTGRLPM